MPSFEEVIRRRKLKELRLANEQRLAGAADIEGKVS